MKSLYYIHSPKDWSPNDLESIKHEFEDLKIKEDIEAAIGEGAGGAGFETVVEVLLDNPIEVATIILSIAKSLWRHRPVRKKLPKGLPDKLAAFRLVVHVESNDNSTIVSVDLDSSFEEIELAVTTNLKPKLKSNPNRLFQNGDDWDVY